MRSLLGMYGRIASVLLLVLLIVARPSPAVELHGQPGDLHGFPSMSDATGKLIADGELTQLRKGERIFVHAVWRFTDGRVAEEDDELRVVPGLEQDAFRWIERRGTTELRRVEVDFRTGRATVAQLEGGKQKTWDEKLDLPAGNAFTGYSTALAAAQFREELRDKDARRELTFVAFTPKPRTVTLEISRTQGESVRVAGRDLAADLFTLHPKIPFPLSLFAKAPDARLWFTHSAPPALLRAQQNLLEKDDPIIVIDVIPRGAALPRAAARAGKPRSSSARSTRTR
jgi:hypothetical protein